MIRSSNRADDQVRGDRLPTRRSACPHHHVLTASAATGLRFGKSTGCTGGSPPQTQENAGGVRVGGVRVGTSNTQPEARRLRRSGAFKLRPTCAAGPRRPGHSPTLVTA